MQKLCIFMGMLSFSYLGWFLGAQWGGFMTAFFVSGGLSMVGVWAGWKAYYRFFV